jgi:hypothetical protein
LFPPWLLFDAMIILLWVSTCEMVFPCRIGVADDRSGRGEGILCFMHGA